MRAIRGLLTGVISVTSDPARGSLAFLALTCTGARAVGVSAAAPTADASTTLTYIAGSLPSKTATETDASGVGAFVNLPVGPVALSGSYSGKAIGSTSVFIRAGFVTSTNLIPTP